MITLSVPPKPKNPRNKEAKKRLAQKTTTSAIDDIFGPGEDGGDGNDRDPYAMHDNEESQSMYRRPATGGMSQSQSQYQSPGGVKSGGPSPLRNSEGGQNGKGSKEKSKKKERSSSDESATEGSETEASDVDEDDNGKVGTKGRSGSPSLDSDGKGKGKQKPVGIISKEQPLQDFEKNLQQEAMISLALEGSKFLYSTNFWHEDPDWCFAQWLKSFRISCKNQTQSSNL